MCLFNEVFLKFLQYSITKSSLLKSVISFWYLYFKLELFCFFRTRVTASLDENPLDVQGHYHHVVPPLAHLFQLLMQVFKLASLLRGGVGLGDPGGVHQLFEFAARVG